MRVRYLVRRMALFWQRLSTVILTLMGPRCSTVADVLVLSGREVPTLAFLALRISRSFMNGTKFATQGVRDSLRYSQFDLLFDLGTDGFSQVKKLHGWLRKRCCLACLLGWFGSRWLASLQNCGLLP